MPWTSRRPIGHTEQAGHHTRDPTHLLGGPIMRKLVACIASISLSTTLLAFFAGPVLAASPNYGRTSEHISQLFYDGYVQCQPSYIQAKQRAARGWLRYDIPGVKTSGNQYTSAGSGPADSRIHSKSYRFFDSFNPIAPKTTFTYGFNWVPVNSPWPYSIDPLTE